MKRFLSKILSLALVGAALFPMIGSTLSRANVFAEPTAKAAEEPTKPQDRLLLPDSYEEYLPLNAPTDVSVGVRYTAIADGKSVYILDRNEHTGQASYSVYTHDVDVTELQFSGDSTLYFLDKDMSLHTLNADMPTTSEETGLHCNAFTIDSDVIYYMTISGGTSKITACNAADIDTPDREHTQDNLPAIPAPAIATYNGNLYYTCESTRSYLYNLHDENIDVRLPQEKITSLAIEGGVLYYTDASGDFYAYNFAELRENPETAPLIEPISGCSAISSSEDGNIYVIQGKSVRRYSPEALAFTDYEISASSASENRLSGASDVTIENNKLYFADTNNARLAVTDLADGSHRVYPCALAPTHVATDGHTAALADGAKILLLDLQTGETLRAFDGFSGNMLGIACVYGKYYFITDVGCFYKIEQTAEGEYVLTGSTKTVSTPKLLSADVFGDLYVACADNKVYRFSEETFTKNDETGTPIATVPSSANKIEIDFDRTVYALNGNSITACLGNPVQYGLEKSLVYSQNSETKVSSFTFDIRTGALIILYDGNFAVSTYDVPVPALQKIAVNAADQQIFGEENADFALLNVPEQTLLVAFDIQTLSGAKVFPYLSHNRTQQAETALRLVQTDRFALVAIFNEEDKTYTSAIVENASCTEIPKENYLKNAVHFAESNVGYLSNDVPLYKYPYLTELLTIAALPKHTQVKVLAQIDDLDYRYYLVEYSIDGKTYTGYLPQTYVNNFDGRPPQTSEELFGDKSTDFDSLWRLAFILLGFASIGILSDYLILRKKK